MAAYNSAGTLFQRAGVTIGEVLQIKGPGESKKEIDVTPIDATSRVRIAGIADGGEVSFDLNYDPTDSTQDALRADYLAGTVSSYGIVLPGGIGTISFSAVILKWEPKIDVDKAIGLSVQMRVSGAVTYT